MTEGIWRQKKMAALFGFAAFSWSLASIAAEVAHSRSATPAKQTQELCFDAHAILQAALADLAGPYDVLANDPPQYLSQPAEPVQGIRRMTPFGRNSGYWRLGWQGQPPSPATVRSWYELPYGSLARCLQTGPEEQSLEDVLGPKVREFKPVDGRTPSVVHVSYPAFDRSKTHAILLVSRFFQPSLLGKISLGGRVELVSLTRTRSGWMKTGSTGLLQS